MLLLPRLQETALLSQLGVEFKWAKKQVQDVSSITLPLKK